MQTVLTVIMPNKIYLELSGQLENILSNFIGILFFPEFSRTSKTSKIVYKKLKAQKNGQSEAYNQLATWN